MQNTKISWCDHSWNPWIGCSRVSEGCRNCYADRRAKQYGWAKWGVKTPRHITSVDYWKQPLAWNRKAMKTGKRVRVFCASLADVFEGHPDLVEPRRRLFDLIRQTSGIDWLLLTKRPEVASMLPPDWGDGYPNVWLGVSVEDMRVAHRLDTLRQIPAVVRFISYEPALGRLDAADISGFHWLIYGGESGPHFRADDTDWARAIRDKCKREGVTFFYKQSSGRNPAKHPKLDGVLHEHWPRSRRMRKVREQTGVCVSA